MNYEEIVGKEVIGKGARVLGRVCEIEIDTKEWKVTHFCLDVNKDATADLGLSKSIVRSVKALLPTSIIDAISDRIILNEGPDELRKIIKPL